MTDHAAAGLGAGVVATLCMNPLDMLKVKFQVATTNPRGGIGKQIWYALRDIHAEQGWKGLYRGVGPNIAGNASSWGSILLVAATSQNLYLLKNICYALLKQVRKSVSLFAKVEELISVLRCCYSDHDEPVLGSTCPNVYLAGEFTGFIPRIISWPSVHNTERRCTRVIPRNLLALFGVSNGAIQFMAYEEMKRWGFERKRRQFEKQGKVWSTEVDKLSNTSYTIMSAASKLLALSVTYPYQVIRSRIQNDPLAHVYPTIRSTIRRTWTTEGFRGFYRGLATNLVRILPGTCVTFVVYENLAWLLRSTAAKRELRQHRES
ncbi:mitochondrial FAD carrier protein flx1 [Paramarasmius palmivorus]|uniref:Mitochondrial FAD carrier protein flx1 n=1 Tax=Paramarasmius palmivorus TaxID=297713 RepID=A0AAW0DSR5_9AGAR